MATTRRLEIVINNIVTATVPTVQSTVPANHKWTIRNVHITRIDGGVVSQWVSIGYDNYTAIWRAQLAPAGDSLTRIFNIPLAAGHDIRAFVQSAGVQVLVIASGIDLNLVA